jgi:hypothetical protein
MHRQPRYGALADRNVSGENPARWRGHLEHLLAKRRELMEVWAEYLRSATPPW